MQIVHHFFLKTCDSASYGMHRCTTRTKSHHYAFKKNTDCGVVCCAPVLQGDNTHRVCILEEKHKTTNLFVAHRCTLLGCTGAFDLLLYDVHRCFICFLNNSAMMHHCLLTPVFIYGGTPVRYSLINTPLKKCPLKHPPTPR
jgi:hypothetical protein